MQNTATKAGAFSSRKGSGAIKSSEYKGTIKLSGKAATNHSINLNIKNWSAGSCSWLVTSADDYQFTIKGLQSGAVYQVWINNMQQNSKANDNGEIMIKQHCGVVTDFKVKKAEWNKTALFH